MYQDDKGQFVLKQFRKWVCVRGVGRNEQNVNNWGASSMEAPPLILQHFC